MNSYNTTVVYHSSYSTVSEWIRQIIQHFGTKYDVKEFFFQMPIKFLELKGKPATWDCIVNKLPSEIFFDFLNKFCLKSIYLAFNFEEFALS